MEVFTTFSIVSLLWILVILLVNRKRPKNLPPGPGAWVVMTKLFQLMREPLIVLENWAQEYGNMFLISIGPIRLLFLNDIEITKTCFSNPAFAGRMPTNFLETAFGKYGLTGINGPHWEELRRFTLREIRDYGFGKPHIKSLIEQQAVSLVESFKGHVGKPMFMENVFNIAALNAMGSIVTGEPDNQHLYSVTERFFAGILSMKDRWFSTVVPPSFPFLGKLSFWTGLNESTNEINHALLTTINCRKSTLTRGDSRNLLESFILKTKEKKNCPESVFHGELGERSMVDVLKELLLGSFVSSSVFMNWKIVYLVKYPAIQRRLQDEIDRVVGNTRHVSIADKHNMTYTQAFMAEVHRKVSLMQVSGFQMALADDYLEGYLIPKGTMLLVNSNYMNHAKSWGDPENFRPERFLEEDGNDKMRKVLGSTFMVGKRSCPGQTFALDTGFLFLTNMLQNFDLRCSRANSQHHDTNDVDYQMVSVFKFPKPCEVILSDRIMQ